MKKFLIEEVRKHENLWKVFLTTFADKQAAINSWQEIADTLLKINITVTPEECRKKWKYLRDNFQKQKRKEDSRSGDVATRSVTWKYFKSLSFLRNATRTTTSIGSLAPAQAGAEGERANASMNEGEASTSLLNEGEASTSLVNEGEEEEEEEEENNREPAPKMRRRSVVNERSEVLHCMRLWREKQEAARNYDSDGLESFGHHVACTVRRLRPALAIQAKVEIQKVSVKFHYLICSCSLVIAL